MRIGLNLLFVLPGQIGGSEVYTRQLIATLGQIDSQNEYLLFVKEHNRDIFANLPYPNFREVCLTLKRSAWLPPVVQRGLEQLRLLDSVVGWQMLAAGVDLVHFPGTTIEPLSLPLPCVLTVHDIQQEYYPQFFSLREKLRRKRFYQSSARKAEQVIAISEFTRQTLLEKYKLSPHKVKTIYFGVAPEFFTPVTNQAIQEVKQKYNLPEKFALFPGRAWPHKNHQSLFQAMRYLKSHYHSDCQLVLCGLTIKDLSQPLQHLLATELQSTIQILGYVSEQDLRAILQTATLMVFPSLFEGFGLPVLEAMASGCPVVCSNTTALPEIAGDAALLVDPLSVEALAQAIYQISMDVQLRSGLIERGLARAKQFTWEATAKATLAVYQETYDQLLG